MAVDAGAGVLHFWMQTDAVGKATALLLAAMSIATWYLLLVKTLELRRVRREGDAVARAFWAASDLAQALRAAESAAPESPFGRLAADLAAGLQRRRAEGATLADALDPGEHAAAILRAGLTRASRPLAAGLGILASVGATAPFVGLFGTVWGIYHALAAIGFSGEASLDKVAGPVGEALVMTALGIAVAVPAVLAYNFLLRMQRDIARDLDGFAQDLHACAVQSARAAAERNAPAGTLPAAGRRGA